VFPGTTRTRSHPSKRKIGHKPSNNIGATINVPNDVFGAILFAADPTAKWPMNMIYSAS